MDNQSLIEQLTKLYSLMTIPNDIFNWDRGSCPCGACGKWVDCNCECTCDDWFYQFIFMFMKEDEFITIDALQVPTKNLFVNITNPTLVYENYNYRKSDYADSTVIYSWEYDGRNDKKVYFICYDYECYYHNNYFYELFFGTCDELKEHIKKINIPDYLKAQMLLSL